MLNYQACHSWIRFERPILERQVPRLHLSAAHPQAGISFWRSDGISITLEASAAEPGLEVEVLGQQVLVRMTGPIARPTTLCIMDRDSGLKTYLPVSVE